MFIRKFCSYRGFRSFLFIVLALLSTVAARASDAHPLYVVSLLPPVDFSPTAMNNAGQIVGFAGTGQGTVHAVLYGDGALTDLGAFFGHESFATAINDAGAITGSVLGASGEQHAFLYQHGSVLDLGAGTAGYGINARGDVVGSQQKAGGASSFVFSGGTLTELANAGGGGYHVALDINDHGAIVGASASGPIDETATRLPWLYRHDQFIDLAAQHLTGAAAINNRGQVAGYGVGPDGTTHAMLYERGVTTDLGGFGDGDLEIHGINAHGTLVGTAFEEDAGLIPFISAGNALVDLNTLVDEGLGWHLFAAYANNDLGQIVGYGCQGDACGLVRLDLASAVPEPGMVWLLLPGLMTLTGLLRQQRNGHPAAAKSIHFGGHHVA